MRARFIDWTTPPTAALAGAMNSNPITAIAAELTRYALQVDTLAGQIELGPALSGPDARRLSASN